MSTPLPPAAELHPHPLEFRGRAGEYFKIWMVNLFLSILTLGIYSAWAKVRNRKYLYGCTFLDGANFDFTASPVSILIGRVLVFSIVLGGAYFAGEDLLRNVSHSLLLVLLLPWALVRSYAFNARNTVYRNVRFHFITRRRVFLGFYILFAPIVLYSLVEYVTVMAGDAWWMERTWDRFIAPAAGADAGPFVEIMVFLLLLAPLALCLRAFHHLKGRHMCWGKYQTVFRRRNLFSYYLAVLMVPLGVGAAAVLIKLLDDHSPSFPPEWLGGEVYGFLFLLLLLMVSPLVGLYLARGMLFRLYWQSIGLPGGGRIQCTFSPIAFALKIMLVNNIATLLSLGLLYPWTQVRKLRYLAGHTVLHMPAGALDEMLAENISKEDAFGDEFEAVEGFGLGIDIT